MRTATRQGNCCGERVAEPARPRAIERPATLRAIFGRAWAHTAPHMLGVVALTLASQIGALLYMWLPWKLLVLISGSGVPLLLPAWLQTLPHAHQVQLLIVCAALAFVTQQAADKLVERLCRSGAARLVRRTGKTGMFNNQKQAAETAYRRLATAFAASVALTLTSGLLLFLQPLLFGSLWCWTATAAALLGWLLPRRPAWRHWLVLRLAWCLNLWAFIGFIGVLCLLAWQETRAAPAGWMRLVLALIVLRQALGQSSRLTQNLVMLHGQRQQAAALFLPHVVWAGLPAARGVFEQLIEAPSRTVWLSGVLSDMPATAAPEPARAELQLLEGGNVAVLWMPPTPSADGALRDGCVIKLFKHSRDAAAQLEADLLRVEGPALPALPWTEARTVKGFACHVLRWPAGWSRAHGDTEVQGMAALRQTLLAHTPSPELVALYQRSRPMLWQRLNDEVFDELQRAARALLREERVIALRSHWPQWTETLRRMPLQVVLPGWGGTVMLHDGADRFVSHHWTGWRIEPLGAAWPLTARMGPAMQKALQHARQKRPALNAWDAAQLERTARLYQLERRCVARNWPDALAIVDTLLPPPALKEAA